MAAPVATLQSQVDEALSLAATWNMTDLATVLEFLGFSEDKYAVSPPSITSLLSG